MNGTGESDIEKTLVPVRLKGRPRFLIVCTHNSARSQMAEGWLRSLAAESGLALDVWSAGSQKTVVKSEAVAVMREVGIDLSGHWSKTLDELPVPLEFDLVLTLCDDANESCPGHLVTATRLHASFPDPSGHGLERWREVRDALGALSLRLIEALGQDQPLGREGASL